MKKIKIKIKNSSFKFLFIPLLFVYPSCEDKQDILVKELDRYLPFYDNGKFGVVNFSGDTLIKPYYDYISFRSIQENTYRVYKDSLYTDVRFEKSNLDSLVKRKEFRPISLLRDTNELVNRKRYCGPKKILEIWESVQQLDNKDYFKIISKPSCSGIILQVVGDEYCYFNKEGQKIFCGKIQGGLLYLSKKYDDEKVHEGLSRNLSEEQYTDQIYLGSMFYNEILPTMSSDLSCEDSLNYNFILCSGRFRI